MTSTSGDATPPSPKTARLMAEMIKLGDQIRRMSYENEERMERMKKENEESLGRIQRSSKALSVRIDNIERRREDRSSNLLMENMRGIGREETIEGTEVGKERKELR